MEEVRFRSPGLKSRPWYTSQPRPLSFILLHFVSAEYFQVFQNKQQFKAEEVTVQLARIETGKTAVCTQHAFSRPHFLRRIYVNLATLNVEQTSLNCFTSLPFYRVPITTTKSPRNQNLRLCGSVSRFYVSLP